MATSQSATFDPTDGLVTFQISFNQTPDFYTTDSLGRAATDFQYFIFGDPGLGYPAEFDSIIRGGEIYLGGGIPVRDATPGVADPHAGGWGAIRGEAPFVLTGTELTFSVPLSVISDHSTDGHFNYIFQTDVYGGDTQLLTGQSIVSPEPATGPITFALAVAALLLNARKIGFTTRGAGEWR
jgi:hypothetical protein